MKEISKMFKKSLSLFASLLMVLNMTAISFAASRVLDANLYWSDNFEAGEWKNIKTDETVFSENSFEPGSELIKYFKIENSGGLAFSYILNFVAEGTIGELAEAIDVYTFTDVQENITIDKMTSVGTLATVINGDGLFNGKMLPDGLTEETFDTDVKYVAIALKMKENASKLYMDKTIGDGFKVQLSVAECAYDNYPEFDKFYLKFPDTDKFLYRVGNRNNIKLSSLFGLVDGYEAGNVTVTFKAIDNCGVTATYTPAANWYDGTIMFSGTGVVAVTIDDDDYAKALTLNLEVIDALNAISATSATANNVVLLNDVGFSSVEVSNGYTLYGNGFKMTCGSDSAALDMSYSFVNLENGTIDNAQIICPDFSHAIMYNSNKTEGGNPSVTENDRTRYYNIKSAVKMDGNSKLVNSYVSGGRVAVSAASGNPVIDNTTIKGGAVANIQLGSANSLLLKDATLIQKPIQATVNDTSKTLMGLSVLTMCDSSGTAAPITIEGDFLQYAWVNEDYSQYVPSQGQSLISKVFEKEEYLHNITYPDGSEKPSVNLGFAYMPSELPGTISEPVIYDNRTNAASVPYENTDITISSLLVSSTVWIYSYKNTNGTNEAFKVEPVYATEKNDDIEAKVVFNNTNTACNFVKKFDAVNGWGYTLGIDLDQGAYNFSFNDLKVQKYGKNLNYTVTDISGNAVSKENAISVQAGTTSYVLNITDNVFYNADGSVNTNKTKEYKCNFEIIGTETSKESPSLVATDYAAGICVASSYGGTWHGAAPALEGIKIKYWSVAEKQYKTILLSDYTPSTTGKLNGTNTTWTYSPANGDFTLTLTGGQVHSSNSVYAMPVVCNGKLYYVAASSKGLVNSGNGARTIPVSYKFEDNNNGTPLTFSNTWSVAENKDDQYKYDDFCNGTLTKLQANSGGGGGCFAEGTLITLADGSKKAIEELTFEDKILVWDFFEGKYTTTVPALLLNDGVSDYDVINLKFKDNSSLRIIYEHGFFDIEENNYVYINAENVKDFIGHTFMKKDGTVTELVDYSITNENIGCYTILTAMHNNCFAEDFFTVTPPPVDGWYDYFEIGKEMKYDSEAMEKDIATYGLYTYDDFSDYISYEEFIAFNGAYLKILVGKGYFTFDDILSQIQVFGVGTSNQAVVPVLLDESAEYNIVSGLNTISAANYSVDMPIGNSFVCGSASEEVTLTASGTASTGYAVITVDGDEYYSAQIPQGESIKVIIRNASGKNVTVASNWGKSLDYGVPQDNLCETGGIIDMGELMIKEINKSSDKVSVVLANTSKYDATGDVYIAVYDADKKLACIKKENKTIVKKTESTIVPEFVLPTSYTVKVFIWETGTMIPVINSVEK